MKRLLDRLTKIQTFWAKIRTARSLGQIRQTARFDVFFAVTIFFPTLLLSYFALSSITAQELSFDADISGRSSAIRARIGEDKRTVFSTFEERVDQRLGRGRTPVVNLGELSPYLLTAFELNKDLSIEGPFRAPENTPIPNKSREYDRLFNQGIAKESLGKRLTRTDKTNLRQVAYREANEFYSEAAESTQNLRLKGQARFAAARAQWLSGVLNPEDAFGDIIGNFASIRDERGFRLSDLARLAQAEIGLKRDTDTGLYAMRELVDQLLSEQWTIGEAGESQIAVRALNTLESVREQGAEIDATWISQSTTRLNARKMQLYWSRALLVEAFDVAAKTPLTDSKILYSPGAPEAGVLWATLRKDERLFLFGFARSAILSDFEQSARALASLDPDIEAKIRPTSQNPEDQEMLTNLGPELPYNELVIAMKDPEGLASRKSNLRIIRITIILLAIGMTGLGIFLSTRLIAREMETARTKADFAANVSHELRSPITQIRLKGESLLLDLCFDEEDKQRHYQAIVRESERLSRLVDNVLDFSAIERGAKRYIFRPEDVRMLLDTTLAAIEGSFEGAEAEIHIDIPDDLPVVWVDREAISQVIVNLVSNAVKYGGDEKWVSLSAQHTNSGVTISVTDRGIGIDEKELPHVFDNFYRSTDAKVRKQKGTGIGLTIVRYIVEAHGGTISVTSSLGEGTTFTLQLPLEAPKNLGA